MILDHDLFIELDKHSNQDILWKPLTLEDVKTQRIAIKDLEWPEIHTMVKGGYIPSSKYKMFDGYKQTINGDVIGEAKTSSIFIEHDTLLIDDKKDFRNKLPAHKKGISGSGVFSSFTYKAHDHCVNDDINVLVSSYINRCLYVCC